MENRMNNTNVLEAIAGALAQSNKSMEVMAQAIKAHSDEIDGIKQEMKAIRDGLVLCDKGIKDIEGVRKQCAELAAKVSAPSAVRKSMRKYPHVEIIIRNTPNLNVWFREQINTIMACTGLRGSTHILHNIYNRFDEISGNMFPKDKNQVGARSYFLFKNPHAKSFLIEATLETMHDYLTA